MNSLVITKAICYPMVTAYDTVNNVTQAACMAHVRSKFTDAQKAGKPEKALTFIVKLYG